jgi:hypothetical protein
MPTAIDPSSEVPGDQTKRDPNHHGKQRDGHPNGEGHLRARHQPAQDVPPIGVGAKQVVHARLGEKLEIVRLRVVGSKRRAEHRNHSEERHDRQADERLPLAAESPPESPHAGR